MRFRLRINGHGARSPGVRLPGTGGRSARRHVDLVDEGVQALAGIQGGIGGPARQSDLRKRQIGAPTGSRTPVARLKIWSPDR